MEDMLREDRKKYALEMLKDGSLSYDKISRFSGLTIEEVKVLADGE